MSEVELEGPSDDELFNEAISDEPPEIPPAETEAVEEPEAKPDAEADAKPEGELTAEKPPIPPKPEWRLREDAERARAAETELANERAEKAALRQRLEALERANQPKPAEPEKAAKPDPLLDPDGYESYLERKFEERQIARDRENSLQQAAKTYKEEFQEAYTAAQQKVDPALRALMQQSRDPGETLIQWHRNEKAKAEVGTDLNAYKAKLREEALKDPEFRKAAMEAWRADAQPSRDGRPRVELPPSLNGASRSNALLKSGGEDVSDEQLFQELAG